MWRSYFHREIIEISFGPRNQVCNYPRCSSDANIMLQLKKCQALLVTLRFRCTYMRTFSHVSIGPADEKALGPFRSVKLIVQIPNASSSFTYHLAIEIALRSLCNSQLYVLVPETPFSCQEYPAIERASRPLCVSKLHVLIPKKSFSFSAHPAIEIVSRSHCTSNIYVLVPETSVSYRIRLAAERAG